MPHPFYTLDVFTEYAFAGNPLAVVLDAGDLDTAGMQNVAREFNLSETVFVLEPRDPVNTARIRIFTPARELPFAGHPTVGTAVLMGYLRAPELMARQDIGVVLEENVGPISCTVRQLKGKAARASFDLPTAPAHDGVPATLPIIAGALGLQLEDIGFDKHVPAIYSAGVPYTCVPVKNLDAIRRAQPQPATWGHAFGGNAHRSAYLYTRECIMPGSSFNTRMFFPLHSLVEDPATGSAAAAFAGVVMQFDKPADGDHTLVLEQGFEMGRRSLITLGLEIAGGELTGASIGGAAVIVSQGTLNL